MGVVEARHRDAGQALADLALDGGEVRRLFRRYEREGVARHLGARRAAHAVDVVLGHVGDVEVDDVRERLDVDAARGDVGRDEDAVAPLLEAGQRLRALRLRAVAVNALAGDALLQERLGQPVGAVLRAREDEHVLDLAALQELEQQRRLQVLGDRVDRLRDPDGGGGFAFLVDRVRVLEHFARQLRDRGRHRRREEERLALDGQVLQDLADVRQEAHVEHAVRFVQDEDLEVVELRVREAEVVEQAARRRDQDVGARAEGVLLRPHGDAAEDGGRGHRRVDGQLPRVLLDLRGQLAGRGQDQRARRAALLSDQAVQDREQEGGRLAAAGHGAGEHVASLHGRRDRVVLDRRRAREAHFLDAAQEIGVESELRERQGNPPGGKNPAGFSLGTEDSPARPTFDAGSPGGPATRALRLSQKATKGKSGGR